MFESMYPKLKKGTLQYRIKEFLVQNNEQGWTSKEIAIKLNSNYGSVSGSLSMLEKNGEVTKVLDSPAAKYFSSNKPSSRYNSNIIEIEKIIERREIIKKKRHELTQEEEKLAKEEEKLAIALEVLTELVV
jgi:hypothetical protein